MEPWPAAFLCPISGSVMADPVIVSTGETYERRCIEAWLELGQKLCVRKRSPIDRSFVVPNHALRNAIAAMARARGVPVSPPSASIARYLAERRLYEGPEENADPAERGSEIGPPPSSSSSASSSSSSSSSEEGRHGVRLGTTGKAGTPRNGAGFVREDPRAEAKEGHGLGYRKGSGIPSKNMVPDEQGLESERWNGAGFGGKQRPKASFDAGESRSSRSRQTAGEAFREQKPKMDGSMPRGDGSDPDDSVVGSAPRKHLQDRRAGEEADADAGRSSGGSNRRWQGRRRDESDDEEDESDDDAFIAIASEGASSSGASAWPSHAADLPDRMRRLDSGVIPRPSSSKAAGGRSRGSSSPGKASIVPPSLVFRPSSYATEEKGKEAAHRSFSAEALAEKLRGGAGHPRMQAEAAMELRSLTRSRANRAALCSSAIIRALIPLLGGSSSSLEPEVQIDAAAALVNLSMDKHNKAKIAHEGAIPALVTALKHGAPEARHHAAGAAFNLSLADENRHLLGVLDAMPPLLDLLRSGPLEAQQDAALALYHLSLLQMNAAKLVKLRAIPVLLGLAKSGGDRPKISYRALHILHNVASIPEGRASLLQLGAITALVELLASPPQRQRQQQRQDDHHDDDDGEGAQIREQAASVLLVLSKGNLRFKFMALQAGALEHLTALARNGTPRARAKALALLELMKESSPGIEDPDSYGVISQQYNMWHNFGGKPGEQSNTSGF